ncbi:IS4 family transposase [Acinetobacter sp. c1-l78]|uniref:IS4 family transposase n=1 Tax=Acinetobacter sp. c1-l78 TaxID=3342803 RepID=UPI0035BB31D6
MHNHTQILSELQYIFSACQHKIDARRIKFLAWLILALCQVQSVNFQKLATHIAVHAQTSSNYRRIQRFMSSNSLPMMVVAKIIYACLGRKGGNILIMDRTNWKLGEQNINILMLAIKHNNVAYPLMFKLLNKRGNSNTCERKALLNDYIQWFGLDSIEHLLADREFVGKDWINYLENNNISYVLRIRNNFKISKNGTRKFCVSQLLWGRTPDHIYHSQRKLLVVSNWCYISVMNQKDDKGKNDAVILISNLKSKNRLDLYSHRWQIECLFKGLKSSGFQLEDTHVKEIECLHTLISVTLLAFAWCYNIGEYVHQNIQKIKIKSHGRRAESVFKYGLKCLCRFLISGYKPKNLSNLDLFKRFLSCT